jgi:hypothetical protein
VINHSTSQPPKTVPYHSPQLSSLLSSTTVYITWTPAVHCDGPHLQRMPGGWRLRIGDLHSTVTPQYICGLVQLLRAWRRVLAGTDGAGPASVQAASPGMHPPPHNRHTCSPPDDAAIAADPHIPQCLSLSVASVTIALRDRESLDWGPSGFWEENVAVCGKPRQRATAGMSDPNPAVGMTLQVQGVHAAVLVHGPTIDCR